MPAGDGDAGLLAQLAQAPELVVDKRFQRRDVEGAHGGRGLFIHPLGFLVLFLSAMIMLLETALMPQ